MSELTGFYINLTQARVILKEEASIEKNSPPDRYIGNPLMYFLD